VSGRGSGELTLAATCGRGLEEVLAAEIVGLGGVSPHPQRGVVRFRGELDLVYRANVALRSAVRVLLQLASGPAPDREALYRLVAAVAWEDLIAPQSTLAVEAAGPAPGFANIAFAALVAKDAVVDRLRSKRGVRPDVDRRNPDVRVHLHLGPQGADVSLDASGEPLSHRGYRPRGGPAPLAESLAAGILLLAGFDGGAPFLDPLCGTGTLAVEAALIATETAPGIRRSFACERWAIHRPELLAAARQQARARERPARFPLCASDADPRAVTATRRNAGAAGVAATLEVCRRDIRRLPALEPGTVLVTNPPYGHRLGDLQALPSFYRDLGDVLKTRAAGSTAWLLVGAPELVKAVGLRPSRRIVLFNGPIECRLVRYDLYGGSGGRRSPGSGGGGARGA
jgi:putative N6-adenine-specific DNA methylase